jgi:hypothetical protein
VLAILALLFMTAPVSAQQSVSEVLDFLVTSQSVQTGAPDRDRAAAAATSDTITAALLANLATLPVATATAGFVYRLNPELGTVERLTETFGPFFVERALTIGRGAASFGVTFQHLQFTKLDGRALDDRTLITTANKFVDEQQPFDVDRLSLDLSADVSTLHGNVGITDRVEIGFAVPLVIIQLSGNRENIYRGRTFAQASASARAVGLADSVIRGKVTLTSNEGAGLAAAVDLRLPTGRQEDLLGAGSTSVRALIIGSIERGRASLHGNAGVSFGGIGTELSFGAAVAMAAGERFTVTAEAVGRQLDSPGHIEEVSAPHPTLVGVQTIRLLPSGSSLNMLAFAPGFKWNLTTTWVLVGNVTFPLTTGGLTAPVTPFVGVDYAFSR